MGFDQDPRDEIQPTKEEWEAAMGKGDRAPITTAQARKMADDFNSSGGCDFAIDDALRSLADQLDAANAARDQAIQIWASERKQTEAQRDAAVAEVGRLRDWQITATADLTAVREQRQQAIEMGARGCKEALAKYDAELKAHAETAGELYSAEKERDEALAEVARLAAEVEPTRIRNGSLCRALRTLVANGWREGHPGETCYQSPWIRADSYREAVAILNAEKEPADLHAEALTRIRERVLHERGPLEVNDVLGIIDEETP